MGREQISERYQRNAQHRLEALSLMNNHKRQCGSYLFAIRTLSCRRLYVGTMSIVPDIAARRGCGSQTETAALL
jgi:hypothetical protein